MMHERLRWIVLAFVALLPALAQGGAVIRTPTTAKHLVIAENGISRAAIVVSGNAGPWERRAASELSRVIGRMTGVVPPVLNAIPTGDAPVLVVGQVALDVQPSLRDDLERVAVRDPLIRSDAIVVQRAGTRVYLVGTNDDSHYFAVAWLLNQWGCRWYLPTDFGEVIPERPTLTIGTLDFAYAPPFQIRHYWLSWNADQTGAEEFRRRNFMTKTSMVGMGHALGAYTRDLTPSGESVFTVPLSEPRTAEHVAAKIEADYATGKDISLAIEDGSYASASPSDRALQVEFDRYALRPSVTDAMMTLYNNVGRILRTKHPASRAKLGGMAYANATLPPKIVTAVEPNVVMWLAPIDIDPNHGMDDPRSPPRQEYRAMMERWAELLRGRLAIYDYDQGMLVWRDLPNPSHHVFAQDVKHYRRAGILGIGTESRGATATTFLNLFFRGQLMWNPDADVDALLTEFYPAFYGPAAGPMREYWSRIFAAWQDTIVTEHEYMAAPAIYTPELIDQIRHDLEDAEAAVAPLQTKANLGRNERLYLERMHFTRLGFEVLGNYVAMVTLAARENAYTPAAEHGRRALAAREALTGMNPTFTTYKVIGESGPMWFPGEVEQVEDLAKLTDGTQGRLIAQTPLQWWFKQTAPVPAAWTYSGPEGGVPSDTIFATQLPTQEAGWRTVRTDVYLQGQGILNADGQSHLGHYWYQAILDLSPEQLHGDIRLMFPGLFNEVWLYINGSPVARRPFVEPWWENDYRFAWEVPLSGHLKPGRNIIAVRGFNPHHFGGIFRRPFVYRDAR